jgi:hypothetical protein
METLLNLYSEFTSIDREASESYLNAKSNKENVVLTNRDGKEVELKEQAMWDEVKYLGKDAPSYKFLSEKYPEVFNKSNLRQAKLKEITTLCHAELDIDPVNLSFGDVIRVINDVVDYKIKKALGSK